MTDTSNYTWIYNGFDNFKEFESYYNMDDYVFDHSNVFILNPRKNKMELRHDLMAMYIYLVVIFTIWLVNYFLEISSPQYRGYVNELAYNRFGMRVYDRVGVEVSDSEEETESESDSEDGDTYSESESESEPDEASEEEDSDTDYEVDISNHGADAATGCFRLD